MRSRKRRSLWIALREALPSAGESRCRVRSDLIALLDRCGALGIHRAVDTTLFASPDTVRSVMGRTDLFLVDLKHMDSGSHHRFTGVPNERILSNLRMIAEAGMDFLIRIPLIEGVNADEENISRSAHLLGLLAVGAESR